MWEHSADCVKDVLQDGAQQRTNSRYQGLGGWHYCPKNHNQHCIYLKAICKNQALETCLHYIVHYTVILVIPLGSRHHLGHGRHKVFVCDRDGIDIKHKFLRWGVDLWVATPQCTQSGLWTHCLDVCPTITWQAERQIVIMFTKTISIQSVVVGVQNCASLSCVHFLNGDKRWVWFCDILVSFPVLLYLKNKNVFLWCL